ncbi:hypothetical protein NBRC10513v2_002532 [Rhodotorula toruloides]|uniref:Uncharacterized protein n=2 Tax=Rhodotorula toruloides TaxID=5286 RepID=A0A0K3CF81_RHOTO
MAAPEPSPAPTLDDSFPGFYPPTPAPGQHASSASYPTTASPDADPSTALDPLTQPHDRIEGAGRALLGAAAGFVVGGPVGAAIGGGLAGLSVVEGEGIAKRFGDRATTPTPPSTQDTAEGKANQADETNRPEFGDKAVEKEQAALASLPAQKLVGGDDAEGAKITGAGALGGALLAGAAGAKVEENEVRAPGTEDDEAERNGAVEPATTATEATPAQPDFGTPAIEKEQAALAASPAQQLLARTDSTAADEVALLAGAAGAKGAVSSEVEEPARAPLEVVTQRAVEAGAGVPSPTSAGEGAGGEALERESHNNNSTTRPALPLPQPSLTSFTADVLAAGSGVHTPSEAPGPAVGGFGMREEGVVRADDRDLPREDAKEEGEERETGGKEGVVHNPSPLVPAAVAGTAAGAALLGPDLLQKNTPKDFEPYTPPALEPSGPPVSSSMSASQPSSASIASASTDATEVPPAPAPSHLKTLNAQNVKQDAEQLPDEADTSIPHARSPEHDQLARGTGAGMQTPMSESIPMQTALEEGPAAIVEEEPKKVDKGKGKEVLGAAALGTAGVGAGVGMKEMLEGDKNESAAPPASQFRENLDSSDDPLTTEEGETGASPAGKHDLFNDQRAYPSVPHMMRTDEAIHDSSVGNGDAARRARVLDPKELAAVPATTPEQAGFTNVGSEITPAMQDFAHLSTPAPQAEQQAIAEGAGAPASTSTAMREEAIEPEKEKDSHHGTLAAGAGLAGIGAGAAGADLLSHDHAGAEPAAARAAAGPSSAHAAEPASTSGMSAGIAPPVGEPQAATSAAPVTQTPAKAPRTPVSRFTEETALPSGAETPSSTRAVMGSPPSSVHERSAATTPLATPGGPTQNTTPTQSLFEAGVLEKSPHLKIQTHKVDGHKRLHRKSLTANTAPTLVGVTRSSHELDRAKQSSQPGGVRQPSPPNVARQPSPPRAAKQTSAPQAALAAAPAAAAAHHHEHGHGKAAHAHGHDGAALPHGQRAAAPGSNAAASGPTGAAGQRPPLDTIGSKNRRDRLLNSMIGVPDPTMTPARSAPTTPPQTAASPPSRTSSDRPGSVATPPRKSIEDPGSAVTYQGVPPISTVTGIASSHPEGRKMVPEAEGARAHTPVGIAGAHAATPAAAPASTAPATKPTGQTTTAPHTVATPTAAAPARHIVETPSSGGGANVHRKLSKRHTQDGDKEKSGFLSRLFGSGKSKHGRTAGGGSTGASPRSSAEGQRKI